ncbi:MAG: glycerol-3-phosphate 1-O-acyltransferase PlsY [Lentisphaeria bacterium]|jgi:glycerol-3-phosphate acyltransferase PlsY|nr:glycerol-3-phosphate 1-O-acyltransferase PlsY [Lentisphaeria bacterium]MDY0176181.1 glycerol-3-phosphate 1-O-acyltransferase PlsY [Lentisphaeria bacterium]NLZ60124.1 glycerol-3-phosphate 1-O-acyltransferase PlsY [Lentisphaerota bacterium]
MGLQSFLAGGLCIAFIAYFVGSIPFGYLIGKLNGVDIRRHGSKNIGATNVRRTLGKDWGMVCFVLDFLKGLLPVIIIGNWLGARMAIGSEWGEMFAIAGTITGHVFPYTLDFKGGKGVATSLGAILGVTIAPVLVGAVVWYITFLRTRMVSLASLVAAVSMPLFAALMFLLNKGNFNVANIVLMCIIAALIIIRHKDNIVRIKNGQESKFSRKK